MIYNASPAPGIDLSLLPPPDVVETLDYEVILAARKARFLSLVPEDERTDFEARIELESEPVTILLEENAYAELLLRQRINEAARQCMLASASGTNLENLAAFYGVARLMINAGDADAIPPVPPTFEADARLRYRAQLAPEGMSTAGPTESYRFHALSADARIQDASVTSPEPGQVVITILASEGDGTPSQDILDITLNHLSADTIRPLTDEVIVQAAEIVAYAIDAQLTLYPGPAPEPALAAAQKAVEDYVAATHRLGYDVTRSGLFSALHRPGVQNVVLLSPEADIVIPVTAAARCADITISVAGATDV
jgi:phage-related baseplate assembly protein